jgi:hypothetical protein
MQNLKSGAIPLFPLSVFLLYGLEQFHLTFFTCCVSPVSAKAVSKSVEIQISLKTQTGVHDINYKSRLVKSKEALQFV